MRLYHLSDKALETLEPVVGPSRHDGEPDGAVGQAVVWLVDDPEARAGIEGETCEYRHEVEVEESDPQLSEDENLKSLVRDFNKLFGGPEKAATTLKWYYYKGPLQVVARAIWKSGYANDPSFDQVS